MQRYLVKKICTWHPSPLKKKGGRVKRKNERGIIRGKWKVKGDYMYTLREKRRQDKVRSKQMRILGKGKDKNNYTPIKFNIYSNLKHTWATKRNFTLLRIDPRI